MTAAAKAVDPAKRDARGRFGAGNHASNGRPPGFLARDLARLHTEAAIDRLVKALGEPRHAVAAAVALLDRGWGKPKETVESTNAHLLLGGIDAPALPETIDAWLQRRHAELATITHDGGGGDSSN